MTHVFTHVCSRCSAEFNVPTAATPRDWAAYPDRILCADCDPQSDVERAPVNIPARTIRPDVAVTFMPRRNAIVATDTKTGDEVELSIDAARDMQAQAWSLFCQTKAAIEIATGTHPVMGRQAQARAAA